MVKRVLAWDIEWRQRRYRFDRKDHNWWYDVETKVQSIKGKRSHEPRQKKSRQVQSNVRVLPTVFFDYNGVLHRELLPEDRTVNKEYYFVAPCEKNTTIFCLLFLLLYYTFPWNIYYTSMQIKYIYILFLSNSWLLRYAFKRKYFFEVYMTLLAWDAINRILVYHFCLSLSPCLCLCSYTCSSAPATFIEAS